MHLATHFRSLAGLILPLMVGVGFANDVPTPELVKEKLEAFDEIFDAGISFRGELKITPHGLEGGQPVSVYQFAFTNQTPRHAFFREANQASAPAAPMKQEKDDGSQNNTTTVEKSEAVYFDDKYSGNLMTWSVFKFDRSGHAKSFGETNTVILEPRSSAKLTLPYKTVAWSSGHSFSKYLKKVTEVRQDEETKQLIVMADGFEREVNPGTWELLVDPAAAYLVKRAVFRNLRGETVVSMSNSGLKEIDGFPFPATATFSFVGAGESRLTFLSAALKVDEHLLAEAKSAVENRKLPNTIFFDTRFGSTTIGHVDSKGEFREGGPREELMPRVHLLPPPAVRRWILLVLNCLVFGSVGLIWIMKRRRERRAMP